MRVLWIAALAGCQGGPVDLDGDGAASDVDCADLAPDVHPGAPEVCNGIDDDCDGRVDQDVQISMFVDRDLDGFGSGAPVLVCEAAPGLSEVGGDCDDLDASAFPHAPERCDGIDNDCDGVPDDALPPVDSFADVDGDGHGDPATRGSACGVAPGRVKLGDDCDDRLAAVHPGASEVCNGLDDDCDDSVDDGVRIAAWVDADGDGWGNVDAPAEICAGTAGFADRDGDCDDGSELTNPDEPEICDGLDDDCDGEVDEGLEIAFHLDADGDGWGDAKPGVDACSAPAGYVADGTDCNDHEARAFPGNAEICDTIDNDCDGVPDDGLPTRWYADHDGDGLGDPWIEVDVCEAPDGFTSSNRDCDDRDPVGPASCPATLYGDWVTASGDARRSGFARGLVGDATASLSWESPFDGQPYVAIARGRLFTAQSLDTGWVYVANDLATGDELWRSVSFGYYGLSGPAWVSDDDGDGLVCGKAAGTSAAELVCLDEETGDERWSQLLDYEYATWMPPVADGGALYTGGGSYYGTVYANAVSDGAPLWVDDSLPMYASGWGASVYAGVAYTWISQTLTAADAGTGAHLWDVAFSDGSYSYDLAPVLADGRAFLANSAALHAVDLGLRREAWSTPDGALGDPVVAGDVVYYVRSDGSGRGIRAADGGLVRAYGGALGMQYTPVVTDDAVLFSSDYDTYVYDRDSGAVLQHLTDGGQPSVADDRLVLVDTAYGTLHVYSWSE